MVQPHRSCKTELRINPVAPQREFGITASVVKHTTSTAEPLILTVTIWFTVLWCMDEYIAGKYINPPKYEP